MFKKLIRGSPVPEPAYSFGVTIYKSYLINSLKATSQTVLSDLPPRVVPPSKLDPGPFEVHSNRLPAL